MTPRENEGRSFGNLTTNSKRNAAEIASQLGRENTTEVKMKTTGSEGFRIPRTTSDGNLLGKSQMRSRPETSSAFFGGRPAQIGK